MELNNSTVASCLEISFAVPVSFEVGGVFAIVANAYCCYLIAKSSVFSAAVKMLMTAQCSYNMIQSCFYALYFAPITAFPKGLAQYAKNPYFRMGVSSWLMGSFLTQASMGIHRFMTFYKSAAFADGIFTKRTRIIITIITLVSIMIDNVRCFVTAVVIDQIPGHFDPCNFKWTGQSGPMYKRYHWYAVYVVNNIRVICLLTNIVCYSYVAFKIVSTRKQITSTSVAKSRKLEIRVSCQFGILAGIQGLQIILNNIAKVVGASGTGKVIFYEAVKYVLCVMDPIMYIAFSAELRQTFLGHIGMKQKDTKIYPLHAASSMTGGQTKSTTQRATSHQDAVDAK